MANEKRLIDANALMDAIHEELQYKCGAYTSEQNKWIDAGLRIAANNIRRQPTVDAVEVVHARWRIEWEGSRDPITGEADEFPKATCPICGHEEYGFTYDDDCMWGKPYNYCPNCSAKMDGGNEDG